MELLDKISQLRRDTSEITCNSLLHAIDDTIISKIEWHAQKGDSYFVGRKKLLQKFADKLGIDFSPDWGSFYTEYFETLVYLSLNRYLCVERVSETEKNTPDYRIDFKGETFYAECKCFMVENPSKLYKKEQNDALNSNIEHEEQHAQGKLLTISSRVITPYDPDKNGFDDSSPWMCIERMRQKILQNYKEGQYSYGNTILFLDISQLSTVNSKFVSILPIYEETEARSSYFTNGELWHLAFGRKDTPIFAPVELAPKGTLAGHLLDDGIMIKQPNICAIVFKLNFDYLFLDPIGLVNGNHNLHEMLKTINCLFNDEKNLYAYDVRRNIRG